MTLTVLLALHIVSSALQVFLKKNDMRCINPRFTYLLTYLFTSWCFLGFDSWGCRAESGVWERNAPVGSRGGAKVGVWAPLPRS